MTEGQKHTDASFPKRCDPRAPSSPQNKLEAAQEWRPSEDAMGASRQASLPRKGPGLHNELPSARRDTYHTCSWNVTPGTQSRGAAVALLERAWLTSAALGRKEVS